jgi:hypothetical protein
MLLFKAKTYDYITCTHGPHKHVPAQFIKQELQGHGFHFRKRTLCQHVITYHNFTCFNNAIFVPLSEKNIKVIRETTDKKIKEYNLTPALLTTNKKGE